MFIDSNTILSILTIFKIKEFEGHKTQPRIVKTEKLNMIKNTDGLNISHMSST